MAQEMAEGGSADQAWRELREALDDAERDMLAAAAGGDDLDVAEGYRWVTETLRTGLELFVENSPGSDVHFVPLISPTRKGLGDNPDVAYDIAPLSREHGYRIRGRRRDAVYLSFCFYASTKAGEMPRWIFAHVSDADLDFDAEGRFELEVGPEPITGGGVRLPAEPSLVIARRYFTDRQAADIGEVSIDYEGSSPDFVPLGPDRLAGGLRACARFLRSIAAGPQMLVRVFGANANTLMAPPPQAPVSYPEDAPDARPKFYYPFPDVSYPCGWFDLGEDEAMVVTLQPPDSRYWSLHLMNRWFGSLDDRILRRTVNSGNATLEPDGSCRVVISEREPGNPNWLWSAGHRNGFVLFRWLVAESAPTPACEVVPVEQVKGAGGG